MDAFDLVGDFKVEPLPLVMISGVDVIAEDEVAHVQDAAKFLLSMRNSNLRMVLGRMLEYR